MGFPAYQQYPTPLAVGDFDTAWRTVIHNSAGTGEGAVAIETIAATLNSNAVDIADATTGNVTKTLPAGTNGKIHTVVRTDASANTVTIAGAGGATVGGETSILLPVQGSSVTFLYSGSNANWLVIGATALWKLDEFTTAGTFPVAAPAWARHAMFYTIGGGGGGGSGRVGADGTVCGGGGSGTAGIVRQIWVSANQLDRSGNVTVGAGGAGGAAIATNDTNGNAGSAGGITSVLLSFARLYAQGGNGGGGGTTAGGTAAASPGSHSFSGGISAVVAGSTGGAAGAPGVGSQEILPFPPRAGGGAGITSANVSSAGGLGGNLLGWNSVAQARPAGGTDGGGNGGDGASTAAVTCYEFYYRVGSAGGGGGSALAANGGRGGNGGIGAGGGGGAAARNGFSSGKGGDGGTGYVAIMWIP